MQQHFLCHQGLLTTAQAGKPMVRKDGANMITAVAAQHNLSDWNLNIILVEKLSEPQNFIIL